MGAKDVTEGNAESGKDREPEHTGKDYVEYLKKLLVDCKIDGKNPAKENMRLFMTQCCSIAQTAVKPGSARRQSNFRQRASR